MALGAFEGVVGGATGGGHLQAGTVEELIDGEDLDAGVVSFPEFGVVEASLGGGFMHGAGRLFQGEENADGGVAVVDGADEIADGGGVHVARFYLDDDGFGLG